GAPPKRDKENDDGDSVTIDEEFDAVSRRAPPLARFRPLPGVPPDRSRPLRGLR
ncbi:MAG: hypothetical protein H6P99_321, partial [Holophagaceae bacterium]|nr:hypothetical protein [Holophagaceae bacterium]